MQDVLPFQGKIALVTGSTRGIGWATASMLAEQGAHVVLSSRKEEACQLAAEKLSARGFDVIAIPGHVGSTDDIARMIDAAVARYKKLDIVVANAATNPIFASLNALEPESWTRILDTNLSGSLVLARLAFPFLAQTGGTMLFVTSINARLGVPGSGAYGISKAAVEQMTRQLAVEWGEAGIRVNAVAPGTTRTGMIRALSDKPGFIEDIKRRTPLNRVGDPEDVAAAIAFLVSDAARHITGQVLTVDGGETISRG